MAERSTPPQPEAGYTQSELEAEAQTLGCYAWDVAGIFRTKAHVKVMTLAEFAAALEVWRTTPL